MCFGEEDDELQHVVVRLLHEQKKTLATVECGTAGMVAEWLGEVEGAPDVYRGGLVVIGPQEPVETMAVRCREQLGTHFGLAVGPFLPSTLASESDSASEHPETITFALASHIRRRDEAYPLELAPRPIPHPRRQTCLELPPLGSPHLIRLLLILLLERAG